MRCSFDNRHKVCAFYNRHCLSTICNHAEQTILQLSPFIMTKNDVKIVDIYVPNKKLHALFHDLFFRMWLNRHSMKCLSLVPTKSISFNPSFNPVFNPKE